MTTTITATTTTTTPAAAAAAVAIGTVPYCTVRPYRNTTVLC